jgi:hypothetical protein
MKVSILRGGGLAGIVTRTELDADRLPPDAARTLEQMVESAGPLEEPAQASSESLPDELQYEVTLEDEHGRHTAHFGDTSIPEPVRKLVEWADARPERTMEIVPQAGSGSTV